MKKNKNIPIQVYLEPKQEKVINFLSKTSGKSKASIIRSCISKCIADLPPENDPAMNIMKLGESGMEDISKKHDHYLTSKKK
ncbi:MAG: hypothetical protein ACMUIS_03485 [bacterium]